MGPMVKVLLLVVSVFCVACEGSFSFPVYRSLQWRDGSVELGSRGASLAMAASLVPGPRRVLVTRWDALGPAELESALSAGAGALLVVLPSLDEEGGKKLDAEKVAAWAASEERLTTSGVGVPVFFALDSAEVRRAEAALAGVAGLDEMEVVVAGPTEAAFAAKTQTGSLHGWLQGISGAADMLPTVAIVAHYDTLAAAVHLASGADSNGSGLAALLELARLFSKIYNQPRNRVAVNFLFVATGGSRMGFAGAEAWAEQMDKQLLERIDFALCLESLGSGSDLHLHFSRPAKTQKIKAVYDVFVDTARDMGVNLTLHRRKVALSAPSFEHEVFAKRHVLAMTLSGRQNPSRGASSLDRLSQLNLTALAANVAFVAEALFKHSFGFAGKSFRAFEGSLAVDQQSLGEWMKIITSTSRAEFVLDKTPGKSVVLDLVRDRLADYTENFVNRTYPLREGLAFRECPEMAVAHASLTRSAFFHVGLVLVALAYLAGVFAGIEYLAKGTVDFSAMLDFSAAAKKRK